MSLFKQILFVLIILGYIGIFYLGNRTLREIVWLIDVILVIALTTEYLIFSYKYSKLKEYFSVNLMAEDKYLVNYGGHCNARAKDGESLHPCSWYWKDEVIFQEKRNITIKEFDEKRGNSLINIENKLCDYEIFLFFLIIIGVLSFYQL